MDGKLGCKQLGIRSAEHRSSQISLCLVRLEATERLHVASVAEDCHKLSRTLHSDVVAQQVDVFQHRVALERLAEDGGALVADAVVE